MSTAEALAPNWQYLDSGVYRIDNRNSLEDGQASTNDAFSEKWLAYSEEEIAEQKKLFDFQKSWFLDLYGFKDEEALKRHLTNCNTILDAGCGLGYKAAWFAELAPHATIVAIDYSNAVLTARQNYGEIYQNIVFAQGDIADTQLIDGIVDFVVCDQVIMHTEDPAKTLNELARIVSSAGEVLCYWYRKKALPRELLDDYFRSNTAAMSSEELWGLSKDVLALGKMLSELKIEADFPAIPALGIDGGKMDLQRFIYWNFIKCFWNPDLGYATSLSTNFDWYSPVNAKRFSKHEVFQDLERSGLTQKFFHEEEACFSGRFIKSDND